MQKRDAIRNKIQSERNKISEDQQRAASSQLVEKLLDFPVVKTSQNYSAYMAVKREINPFPFIEQATKLGKNCYLPVLSAEKQLTFYFYKAGDQCVKNRFGIAEPKNKHQFCIPSALDFVLLPLLAFDAYGNRLGMGGGYYDRTFDFLLKKPRAQKPLLIGLGYEFQRVDELVPQQWDVPLDAVVTEQTIYQFNHFSK